MKTVAIPMKTVARAMKTVVVATSSRNFPCIFETQSAFVLLQAILRELSFITLSVFMPSGNQKECFSERAAHLTPPIVRQEGINHEKSQTKIDQDFGRNRKTALKGGYCKSYSRPTYI
ncbi:hypothetical protein [Parabacteroides sp. AF17-28]|uniref:hypothetical protein n=1 Tax=Parabacteroides sp. AF17-28 TaxID=2292241 RepID=UPI000F000C27|nr:hypothetical protein [Parabacteroides sp. AF17-28]RHR49604.1 hypothetical protein DWW90_19500 [Parabacteroides sp. AF17-28]